MHSGGVDGSGCRGFALRSLVLALLLLAAPLAAAEGPGATVRTLTSDGSCSASSAGWSEAGSYTIPGPDANNTTTTQPNGTPPPPVPAPGGYGYWAKSSYETSSRCENESDVATASASDDHGRIGGATVGAWNESSDARGENSSFSSFFGDDGSSWGSGQDAQSASDQRSSARGAKADALGASASATSGCTGDFSGRRESSGSWSQGAWSRSDNRADAYTGAGQNACGDTVALDAAGHGFSAGNATACRSTYDAASSSGSWGWNDGNASQSYGSSSTQSHWTNGCRSGIFVDADGQEAFAGNADQCSRDESSWQSWSSTDNGTYGSSGNNQTRQSCFSGTGVWGPDDLSVTMGQDTQAYGGCWQENGVANCHGSEWRESLIRWGWASSPVEPLAGGEIVLPLP